MVDEQNPIPSPQSGDSDDVELALETAQRLHRNGDPAEALKWLRRAANSADEAGDDRRQLELARAAADYTSSVTSGAAQTGTAAGALATPGIRHGATNSPSRLPQPPTREPPPPPSTRASVAPNATADAISVVPASPPSTGGPPPLRTKTRSTPAPPNASTSIASQKPKMTEDVPSVMSQKAQTLPSQIPAAPRAVTTSSLSQNPPLASNARPSAALKSAESESRLLATIATQIATKPALASSVPEKSERASSGPPSGFHDIVPGNGSVRVSVRVSARDENLYVVRPLPAGQRVPVGSREAYLVFQEASAGVGLPAATAQ